MYQVPDEEIQALLTEISNCDDLEFVEINAKTLKHILMEVKVLRLKIGMLNLNENEREKMLLNKYVRELGRANKKRRDFHKEYSDTFLKVEALLNQALMALSNAEYGLEVNNEG